jgi:WYL_2, Sm-like SH3 beta-barrel fold
MKLQINGCTLVIEGDQTVKIEFGEKAPAPADVLQGQKKVAEFLGDVFTPPADLNRNRRSILPSREALIDFLSEGVCQVKFTKTNGESRTAAATLLAAYISPALQGHTSTTKDVVPFWSVADDGWRSFRLVSVEEFRDAKGNLIYRA